MPWSIVISVMTWVWHVSLIWVEKKGNEMPGRGSMPYGQRMRLLLIRKKETERTATEEFLTIIEPISIEEIKAERQIRAIKTFSPCWFI